MMYRLYILIFILVSCGGREKIWSPEEEESMARIMMDVHMAQAALRMAPLEKRDSIEKVYWSQIAAIHNKNEEDIKEQIELLKDHPEQLEKILNRAESIVDSIKSGPRSPENLNN
jgi:ActR/RegA family two-component response regulator